ncbi:MAG TPA: hypothetical protein VMA36_11045 [Candidatus Limnocylindria bacterium]|nr:hypothetical protein [Candidatus Limnocylindria bacterium]
MSLAFAGAPARAERPLPDSGKWDRTFALYARDVAVPWKKIVVRLDTYSGAPVDFAAYEVDPADVIVAGSARARAIDTTHRTPVARWRFSPPSGLRYTPNEVEVPLQNREGFFVIEARRGDAVQQTWLDLTRVGLLTKESAGGIVLYGADLRTGNALAGMRITYLVGTSFQYGQTDAHGIARWTGATRPRFALAEWGKSRTFVSFLPQAPVPPALVGVRTERASVRAGEHVRVVGFARRRVGTAYRPASGDARVMIVARGRTLAQTQARLDPSGAFVADLPLPATTPAGDAAVLASAGGASGGAAIHIDGAGDVVLSVSPVCAAACAPDQPLPLAIAAKRADGTPAVLRDVRVRVVRAPHVIPPGTPDDVAPWGTTLVDDEHVKTDATGAAQVSIPAPTDGLASTYGITVTSGASTATARVVTPTARVALWVTPVRADLAIGEAAAFDVRGFDAADGHAAAGLAVHLRLEHGPTVQEQQLTLDGEGRAHAVFRDVVPGTNLAFARASLDGKTALDVNAVTVEPQAVIGATARVSGDVHIATDKPRYRVGDRVTVDASLSGAYGDAFVTLEGARPLGQQAVATSRGHAGATFTIPETVGDASIGVAFVHDGALEYATQPIAVDGPGHARATALAPDAPAYAPGTTAHLTIADGAEHADATLAIRVGDALAASGAAFDAAPGVLAGTGTTTQDPASADPAWHASVVPTGSTALDLGANERSVPAEETLGAAAEHTLFWKIDRADREGFDVPVPQTPGRYVVSVLKISGDGDVGAANAAIEVRP